MALLRLVLLLIGLAASAVTGRALGTSPAQDTPLPLGAYGGNTIKNYSLPATFRRLIYHPTANGAWIEPDLNLTIVPEPGVYQSTPFPGFALRIGIPGFTARTYKRIGLHVSCPDGAQSRLPNTDPNKGDSAFFNFNGHCRLGDAGADATCELPLRELASDAAAGCTKGAQFTDCGAGPDGEVRKIVIALNAVADQAGRDEELDAWGWNWPAHCISDGMTPTSPDYPRCPGKGEGFPMFSIAQEFEVPIDCTRSH